jgi:hypothetical protein
MGIRADIQHSTGMPSGPADLMSMHFSICFVTNGVPGTTGNNLRLAKV